MKTPQLPLQKLSKNADISIRRKLFFASLQKQISELFSFSTLKIAVPAFAFALFVFGFFVSLDLNEHSQNQSNNRAYIEKSQLRVQHAKKVYLKKMILLRGERIKKQ